MVHFLTALGVLLAYLVSVSGWGWLAARLLYREAPRSWPYAAALGLCAWIFLGGLLNALHLAYRPALDGLAALGLALAAGFLLRAGRGGTAAVPRAFRPALPGHALPALTVWGATLFVTATLVPTNVFNHHDDMQKYFVPPLRMLATGTVGGNPFDTVGLYHLGPQSFLQGFVVGHFPLADINAFDAVFCFLLAGLLIDALGRRMGAPAGLRLLAVLAYIAVNPQYTNISAVYSGSLMVAGLVFAAVLLWEALETGTGAARAALAVGGFAAALFALKATFLPFAGAFLVLLFLFLGLSGAPARRIGAALGAACAAAVGVVLPWAVASGKDYAAVLFRSARIAAFRATHGVPTAPTRAPRSGALHEIGRLFSGEVVYFRHAAFDYGVPILLIGLAGLVAAACLWRSRGGRGGAYAGVGTAAAVAAAGYGLASPVVFGLGGGIRYLSPILLVVLPCAALVADRGTAGAGRAPWRRAAVALGLAGVVGLFGLALVARGLEAYRIRTLVSFPLDQANLQYRIFAFSDVARSGAREAQASTPPGAPILTWISTPFHLDFARNPVLTIPDPDFAQRWAHLPLAGGPEAVAGFLRERGIRYVMWEYRGAGMRDEASLRRDLADPTYRVRGRLTLLFRQALEDLGTAGHVVHDDGFVRVIDLGPG